MNKWTAFCNGLKLLRQFIVFWLRVLRESLMPKLHMIFMYVLYHA